MKHYLIIGNGVAGTTAAEYIRKHDAKGEITILSEESFPFYYRIRLNEYISGEIDKESLIAKNDEWYTERKIRLITDVRITEADPEKRLIKSSNNEQFSYDLLLIATGSKAFVPPIPGTEKPGVFTLRSVDDAKQIIQFCKNRSKVLLLGGGLLGLETGNALRKQGKEVTVIEFFPRLLPRQLDDKGAAKLKNIMEEMGFSFRLGAITKEITGAKTVESVVLESNEVIPTETVILSAGVRPNLELAKCLGLSCGKGITVDSQLRTSRPDIFAAGDVAEFEHVIYGIWPAAMEQGKAAGTNMANAEMEYHGSLMANKLKVVGIDLASAGEINVENKFEEKINETDTGYRKIVIDNNHVIGCIMLGDTSGFSAITRAITEKTDVSELKL
ncbi:MAG: FAD-dependent oxidoreductase [Proteobacteria bacterium]|nr:FAD-dependent oxidoreductase [Pseudomonadota bacterium]MBU1715830.1 FAD-dependent oxidoreductase [Pseudomonadota bacterium]